MGSITKNKLYHFFTRFDGVIEGPSKFVQQLQNYFFLFYAEKSISKESELQQAKTEINFQRLTN